MSHVTTQDNVLEQVKKSEKNFKFGGGEQRTSLDCVKLPCYMETVEGEEKLLFIISEVVETDLPLLIGAEGLKNPEQSWTSASSP